MEPPGSLPYSQEPAPVPRPCVTCRDKLVLYGEELLAPRPTPKVEDHPLSAVRDSSFSILTSTLRLLNGFRLNLVCVCHFG
jgi:hypothetical protein